MNATVSLSISELDALRDAITNLTKERDNLASHQMEVVIRTTTQDAYRHYDQFGRIQTGYDLGTKVEYKNLDLVRKDIHEEEERKVIKEVEEAKRDRRSAYEQIEKLKTKHNEELLTTESKHTKDIKQLEEQKKELENQIKELKNQEFEKTKDRQISELIKKVQELESRKWYQMIF